MMGSYTTANRILSKQPVLSHYGTIPNGQTITGQSQTTRPHLSINPVTVYVRLSVVAPVRQNLPSGFLTKIRSISVGARTSYRNSHINPAEWNLDLVKRRGPNET
ncbi:hypothetical protein DPEC_G00299300 [Dallia pectoralis]|uniref:Uncharacterized protein n=1 Tax=Dallia pectoralis TaxID=75939 RepID=A0ACC2FG40_DALPE|nr:hypothetical protein DPEC_G00299300 [Dallia pectoralis]